VAVGQIGIVRLIGLPGNSVAVCVTCDDREILKLGGAAPAPLKWFPVRAGFAYRKTPGRHEYLRASLERGGDGLRVNIRTIAL
jgi:molybdopterin molybdotransferase